MSPTIEATIVQAIQVLISLVTAYVLLRLLRGTALINRKGLQLGGSVAVFVVVLVLLNRYLPEIQKGISSEAAAAQEVQVTKSREEAVTVSVSISPAAQLVTRRDLDSLDRNQFVVDETLEIAITREPGAMWETKTFPSIDTVSVFDIPAMGIGTNAMRPIMFSEKDKPIVFGSRTADSTRITIDKASILQSIPASFNFFEDKTFMATSMKSQVEIMVNMGALPADKAQEYTNALIEQGPNLASKLDKFINSSFPIIKDVHDGVYVTVFTKEYLRSGFISKVMPESSLLDLALTKVAYSGSLSGVLGNLYVDQSMGIASFNSSLFLRKVLIRGSSTDVRVNHVGFLVAGRVRVIAVDLIYLSTDDIAVFQKLQDILNSLRFTG